MIYINITLIIPQSYEKLKTERQIRFTKYIHLLTVESWATYGYWGLFFAAFLAGSIIPFGAEVLIGILLYNGFPLIPLILVATLGNWLGGYSVFYMGYYTRWDLIEKYLKIHPDRLKRFQNTNQFSSELLALFCWIPIVGSLILISLGILRCSVFKTGIFMFIGRLLRYWVWALMSLEIIDRL